MSTQNVELFMTDPIESYSQPPIGQSDVPTSPHFRDQAEELFSRARFKPSWFQLEDLLDGNVTSKVELRYAPRPE